MCCTSNENSGQNPLILSVADSVNPGATGCGARVLFPHHCAGGSQRTSARSEQPHTREEDGAKLSPLPRNADHVWGGATVRWL